jgi:hypothetical protein
VCSTKKLKINLWIFCQCRLWVYLKSSFKCSSCIWMVNNSNIFISITRYLSHEWDNIQCVEWDGVPFKTLLYNYLLFIFTSILINFRFIMVGKGKKIVRISLASMEKVVKDVINNKISIPMQVKNIIYQNQHCIKE